MCHQGIQVLVETIRTHKKILTPSKSNSEVDSTSHYKESIAL